MTNEPSSEANSDKLSVDAICIYCNKRFTSMRSVLQTVQLQKGPQTVMLWSLWAVENTMKKQDLGNDPSSIE